MNVNVSLCDKCAPLLGRPDLSTTGKLAAKLCLKCKARLGAAVVASGTQWGSKLERVVEGALQLGTASVAIAAAAETAAAVAESTLEQLEELGALPRKKKRKRRLK